MKRPAHLDNDDYDNLAPTETFLAANEDLMDPAMVGFSFFFCYLAVGRLSVDFVF